MKYSDKYRTKWWSYSPHYNGALRGNRISVERMEWVAEAYVLGRLQGLPLN